MTRRPAITDLRGAARLATDATAGLVDLVEAMHERIARVPGFGSASPAGRTRGITGLVYKSVRGVTRVVGGSVDALLGLIAPALDPALDPDRAGPEREALVAALNGVLGDHLVATANPLATPMSLRRDGRRLMPETAALAAALPDAGGGLLVLVHGLCMNDLQWARAGHDHGAFLAHEAGFTPVYLRYNSGQPLSLNGRELAQQLGQLVAQWPQPLERIVLIGHSMGGLVVRSALHEATLAGQRWPEQVADLVFLGTPHHGAPLERAGHWIDVLLGGTPYAAPFARLGKLRSAGITDLRHGSDQPLPANIRCFAIAGSIGGEAGHLKERLLGDGLVPLASALGRHADPARALVFAPERQWVARGVGHLALLHDAGVAAQLRRWLA
jgi:pimeloyl-ACP methyl ester carboxylesterase